jgi:hypothetical protein
MTPDTAYDHDWQARATDPDRESDIREAVEYSQVGLALQALLNRVDDEMDKQRSRHARGVATDGDRAVFLLCETITNALGVADQPWSISDAVAKVMEK